MSTIIGQGIGIPFSRILGGIAQQDVAAFRQRVQADGGTFEAEQCMINSVQSLLNIDLYPVGDASMIALRNRVVADGGTFEAYNCGIIAIQSLANIDLD